MRPRDAGFILFAIGVGIVCLRLGVWQLERRAERRQANAEIRARQSMPPVDLNSTRAIDDSLAYRHALGRGTLDGAHQVLLTNRSYNGEPGVHSIVPLRLEGKAEAILVDRGWMPLTPAESGDRPPPNIGTDALEIGGILMPTQTEPRWAFMADRVPASGGPPLATWRVLYIPGIQIQTPYPLLPLYLAATGSTSASEWPKPDVTMDLSEGPHLSYAIQWLAFCAIAWAGAALYARRRGGGKEWKEMTQ